MVFSRFRKYSDTFIETGTCHGGSIDTAISAGFTDIRSVEVYLPLYEKAVQKFAGTSVKLFLGKSTDRLEEMIQGIPIPSVFWLDAHPSGPKTGGHDDLMSNPDSEFHQDKILTKELAIILNHGRHVILIDDQHGWQTARQFADIIDEYYPDAYEFSIDGEERAGIYHKDKVLVCLPL